ncbi:unnamed protein product [Polarella glacialis]|uniref:Uncharacterized protein n=1 Tax=Polarella glacialis TaxID=89957 RepID=A0A813LVY2_POLGL|nr:unnamed protein product [Polarella glacialis]CAE8740318.1 unnamed protein product [Polarella glacialis]
MADGVTMNNKFRDEDQGKKEGTALLAEVCRSVCQAAEQECLPEPSSFSTAPSEEPGAPVVPSALPLWELNVVDPIEGTALHFATSRQLRSAAMALLARDDFSPISVKKQRGIDGSTALHLAAAEGLDDVVEALLARSDFADAICVLDKDGYTALHGAAFRGHASCARQLLASPLFSSELVAAEGRFDARRTRGHWAIEAAELYDMSTALHMAAARGHAELCAEVMAGGLAAANKVNRLGATALHMAAKGGHASACSALLKRPEFTAVNARDARGFTALHWAAQQVSADVCAAILESEDLTELDCRDLRGRTAIEIAEEQGHFEVQRLLLRRRGTCIRE